MAVNINILIVAYLCVVVLGCISTGPKLRNHPQSPLRLPEAFQDSRPSTNLTWSIDIIEKCSCYVLLRHSINTAKIKNQFNNSNLLCSCISLLIINISPPPQKKNTPTHIRSETADQQPLQSLHLPRSVRPEQHLWYINGQNPAHQLMRSSRMFIGICMALYIGAGFCPSAAWAHWTWFWAWVVGLFPLCTVLSGCDISPSLHKIKLLQRWWNSWKMPMRVDSGKRV